MRMRKLTDPPTSTSAHLSLKVSLMFPPRPSDTTEWLHLDTASILDPGYLLPSSVALSSVFNLFEFQFFRQKFVPPKLPLWVLLGFSDVNIIIIVIMIIINHHHHRLHTKFSVHQALYTNCYKSLFLPTLLIHVKRTNALSPLSKQEAHILPKAGH